ncbi:MAG TPA: hypothetical protein VL595_36585 [Pseudonocardia sp.]|nr:hypothetical protein [Pseudonocardia sp.]
MTQSITPRNGAADISAAVPTQRIVTSEVAANRVRDSRGRFTTPETPDGAGSQPPPASRSTTGRSRSADRAERAARARAERAAARAKAESAKAESAKVEPAGSVSAGSVTAGSSMAEPAGSGHADPMEDRAKRFRAAVSELAADRQGAPLSGHGGPLVRARAARSATPAGQPPTERSEAPAERPTRARATRSASAAERPQRSSRPQRLRTPERPKSPAQRPPAPMEPQVRLRSPLADLTFDHLETTSALPDLTAALGAIPGGLGAEVVESFVFAGQQWTSVDADATGSPIGVQLAMEQRGLVVHGGAAPGLDTLPTQHLDGQHADGGYAVGQHLDGQHADGGYAGGQHADGGYAGGQHAGGEHLDARYPDSRHTQARHPNAKSVGRRRAAV